MTSRRSFLHLLGAGLITPFVAQAGARQAGGAPAAKAVQLFAGFGGVLGLQLYSLRLQMEKDVPGTLKMVRDWGLSEVETAGYYGRTAAAFAEELKRANLTAKSMHAGYELLRDNVKQVVADAKALGATYVTTAWIPHKAPFKLDDIERAAAHFTRVGPRAEKRRARVHVPPARLRVRPGAKGHAARHAVPGHSRRRGALRDGRVLGRARWR